MILLAAAAGVLGLAWSWHAGTAERAGPGRSARSRSLAAEDAARRLAVSWVARQVSRDTVVACDRVICSALAARGFPVGSLLVLGPVAPDLSGSAVVIATADIRSLAGGRLDTSYAPELLAVFDSGRARIDIRAVAPDGAVAYRAALSADLRARKASGSELLRNEQIVVAGTARRQLADGQVDSRLLIAIATMAAQHPVRIVGFGSFAPDASAGSPLRFADIAETGGVADPAGLRYAQSVRALLGAQSALYRPLRTEVTQSAGQAVLRIEYPAPSPLGLLGPPGP